jgi:hypothetical protein
MDGYIQMVAATHAVDQGAMAPLVLNFTLKIFLLS